MVPLKVSQECPSGNSTRPVTVFWLTVPLTVPLGWMHPVGHEKVPETEEPVWLSDSEMFLVTPATDDRIVPCQVPMTDALGWGAGVG